MSKERPIIFNSEMVRAILDGRKTQTRRPIKRQPKILDDILLWVPRRMFGFFDLFRDVKKEGVCPFGKPGDRLWVRETWTCVRKDCLYKANPNHEYVVNRFGKDPNYPPMKWRPSIHMPRWASRITLEITNVRVERMQDISMKDVRAEGTLGYEIGDGEQRANRCFAELWDSIYGGKEYEYSKNPWVWVVEFKKL